VNEGLKATPYIGPGNNYEASLICKIDEKLGSIMSHYGRPFSYIANSFDLKMWLKNRTPGWLYYIRNKHNNRKIVEKPNIEFMKFVNNSSFLNDIKTLLLDTKILINFEEAMLHYGQRPTTFSVGMFLKSFHNKIKW
jgi:hypothetical protein